MAKRHQKSVGAVERTNIALSYFQEHMPMVDVASKHHVSASLVGRICRDYSSGGAKIGIKRMKEESTRREKSVVAEEVLEMLRHNRPIWNSKVLQEKIKAGHALDLTRPQICKIMRKDFKLGYRKVG